jgi:hypothetical protein
MQSAGKWAQMVVTCGLSRIQGAGMVAVVDVRRLVPRTDAVLVIAAAQ